MNRCFFCNAPTEKREMLYTQEVDKCIIIIRDVPTDYCDKCGHKTYDYYSTMRIEEVVKQPRDKLAETLVVRFSDDIWYGERFSGDIEE